MPRKTYKTNERRPVNITLSLRLRMSKGVDKRSEDECWPWKGCIRNGYGAIKHDGAVFGTHVVAFVIAKGPVPDGLMVTHACDNKVCCNPAHLAAKTTAENVKEAHERLPVLVARGEEQPNAKLTREDVLKIRELYQPGRVASLRIAKLLNLPHHAVRSVLVGKSWKHVQLPVVPTK